MVDYLDKLLDDLATNPLAQAIIVLAIVAIRVTQEVRKMRAPKPHHHHKKGKASG